MRERLDMMLSCSYDIQAYRDRYVKLLLIGLEILNQSSPEETELNK